MKKAKLLPYKDFKYIYEKVPRLCVDLVIKSGSGIVLAKRDITPAKGYWHFPGGTILFNENITDTANRVAAYEVGLKIKIIKTLGIIDYSSKVAFGHSFSIVLLVEPLSNNLSGSDQGKEVSYFKSIPPKTILEQVNFLKEHKLLS